MKSKAILFDMFVDECEFFNGNTEANNGYGCNHPEQKEKENGQGCCFCFSCPRGYSADEEDFDDKDIDWSETDIEDVEDIEEDSYIIVLIEN